MVNLAIFGSGRGSNAEKIIERFQSSTKIRVALIASNKEDAGILELSKKHDIPSHLITDSESLIEKLSERKIEYIALAGYLKKISPELVKAFPDRMFNIHPSLLPKYGGKGMYGLNVHKKVIENGDKNSGITIHYVNENYDEGTMLFQDSLRIEKSWNANELANAILQLEHQWYATIIEKHIIEQKSF